MSGVFDTIVQWRLHFGNTGLKININKGKINLT